jgi:hypothetical protein
MLKVIFLLYIYSTMLTWHIKSPLNQYLLEKKKEKSKAIKD